MNVNFILAEMTFLRYFAPVAVYLKQKGHECAFVISESHKYNSPTKTGNLAQLELFCAQNSFSIQRQAGKADVTFLVEGVGIEKSSGLSVSFVYQTDFLHLFKKYRSKVDCIVFPSEYIKEFYGYSKEENILCLGIPKYLTTFSADSVHQKYGLDKSRKHALIIWPKNRDLGKVNMSNIIQVLLESGSEPILKTRGKDPIPDKYRKYKNFADKSWHPHTTCELLKISDIAINFGSTSIEECVMFEVPVLNFDVKPRVRHGLEQKFRVGFEFLYEGTSIQVDDNNFAESVKACEKEGVFDFDTTKRRYLNPSTFLMDELYGFLLKNT